MWAVGAAALHHAIVRAHKAHGAAGPDRLRDKPPCPDAHAVHPPGAASPIESSWLRRGPEGRSPVLDQTGRVADPTILNAISPAYAVRQLAVERHERRGGHARKPGIPAERGRSARPAAVFAKELRASWGALLEPRS